MARFQYQALTEPVTIITASDPGIGWYPEYPDPIKADKRHLKESVFYVQLVDAPVIFFFHPEYPDFANRQRINPEQHRAHVERFEIPVPVIEYWYPEYPDYFKPESRKRQDGLFTRSFDTSAFVPVANFNGLIRITNIQVTLAVKKEVDSGFGEALAADTTGTIFYFNKSFKDIDSITVTANSTTERICVVDFVDVANPTQFKVLVFDKNGTRQDATVRWIARGIV